MARVADSGSVRVLYSEPGAGWWPLLWGPAFALIGLLVELFTPGPKHPLAWLVFALVSCAAVGAWVRARRRFGSVCLTTVSLRLGGETVPIERVVSVEEEAPPGGRVLGGGWVIPRGTGEVPVRLRGADDNTRENADDDGSTVVLAWARDPEALAAALRSGPTSER